MVPPLSMASPAAVRPGQPSSLREYGSRTASRRPIPFTLITVATPAKPTRYITPFGLQLPSPFCPLRGYRLTPHPGSLNLAGGILVLFAVDAYSIVASVPSSLYTCQAFFGSHRNYPILRQDARGGRPWPPGGGATPLLVRRYVVRACRGHVLVAVGRERRCRTTSSSDSTSAYFRCMSNRLMA